MSGTTTAPLRIVIACEAGVASSVLLSAQLTKQLRGVDVVVRFAPVDALPRDADLVLAHRHLSHRLPSHTADARVVVFDRFVGDPAVQAVVAELRSHAAAG